MRNIIEATLGCAWLHYFYRFMSLSTFRNALKRDKRDCYLDVSEQAWNFFFNYGRRATVFYFNIERACHRLIDIKKLEQTLEFDRCDDSTYSSDTFRFRSKSCTVQDANNVYSFHRGAGIKME